MKTRTAAALLACTLAACSDDVATPVAPSAPAAAPEPAAAAPSEPTASGLPAAAPAFAGLQPLEPPSIDIDPPMRFDLPQLPESWFERPAFPAAGHRRYTGLRIESDSEYPGRINVHETEKLRAVITRNDGVSATSAAEWRTGNTHVATVNQHGHVTAHNPGRFDTIATARGLEARMTGMEVYPGPSLYFDDQFWQEIVYDARDNPGGRKNYIWTLAAPLPGFYLWLGDPEGRQVASDAWIPYAERNFPRAVESLTGKPYRGRIESGLTNREQKGWITVVFDAPPYEREPPSCGRGRVGANPGRIWFYLKEDLTPYCGGEYPRDYTSMILHEIGHALGFFHVSDGRSIMSLGWKSGNFPTQARANDQYHARLAYRLGRGFREYCGWPLRVECGYQPRRGAAPRMLTLP